MESIIIAILSIMATIIAALIGALIPTFTRWIADRKRKRVIPTIAVWNNCKDDIDERLNNNTLRWFIDLDNIDDYTTGKYIYLVLRSDSKYRMSECEVKIICDSENRNNVKNNPSQTYKIGLIIASHSSVFAIPISKNKSEEVECYITYYTEANQKMRYSFKAHVDIAQNKVKRIEEVSELLIGKDKKDENGKRISKCGRKTIYPLYLSDSYTSSEVKKKLGKKSLNYHQEGDSNGNNN